MNITNRSRVCLCAISTGEYGRANGRLSLWRNEALQVDRFPMREPLTKVVHNGARRQSARLRNLVYRLSLLKELPGDLRRPHGTSAICPLTGCAVRDTIRLLQPFTSDAWFGLLHSGFYLFHGSQSMFVTVGLNGPQKGGGECLQLLTSHPAYLGECGLIARALVRHLAQSRVREDHVWRDVALISQVTPERT